MKAAIHPTYFPNAQITCSCGAVFVAGSTMEKIQIDVCSACHPFYTGKQKLVDTAGRVDKFKSRQKAAEIKKVAKETHSKAEKEKSAAKKAPAKKAKK